MSYVEELDDAARDLRELRVRQAILVTASRLWAQRAEKAEAERDEARDELARVRRGAEQLGRTLDAELRDIVEATGSHDLIGEDGDGDWALVNERLLALRPRALAAEATLDRVRALHRHLLWPCAAARAIEEPPETAVGGTGAGGETDPAEAEATRLGEPLSGLTRGSGPSPSRPKHGFTPATSKFSLPGTPESCRVLLARGPCPQSREEHDPSLPPEDLDVFGRRRRPANPDGDRS